MLEELPELVLTSPEDDELLLTSPEVEELLDTSPEVEELLLTSPEVDELLDTSPEVEELLETSPEVEELLDTSPDEELETSPEDELETSPEEELETFPEDELETSPELDTSPDDELVVVDVKPPVELDVEVEPPEVEVDPPEVEVDPPEVEVEVDPPDVVVLIGNDQREIFKDSLTPAFSILHGASVDNVALDEARLAALKPGLALAHWANVPEETVSYPCVPELGEHLITSLMDDGFDIGIRQSWENAMQSVRDAGGVPYGIPAGASVHKYGALASCIEGYIS